MAYTEKKRKTRKNELTINFNKLKNIKLKSKNTKRKSKYL